jgi:hypothetical protein
MAVNYYKTYSDAAGEAQRQQRLAELLQRQSEEPMQQYSYQGIQAMPSYAAGLAKILSAYGAERARRKSEEAQKEAKMLGREEFKDYMTAFEPTERKLGTALDVAAARPEDRAAATMIPQNINMDEVAKSIGAPTAGIAPQGTGPAFQAPQFAVGGAPMTPAQRRAKLLEGLGSDNPMILEMAKTEYAKKPELEEFYQPTETATGQLVQFGKHGGKRETGLMAAPKSETMSTIGRLIKERDALPPGDPRRASYDSAIAAETAPKGTTVNVDTKGTQVGQELFLKRVDEQYTNALKSKKMLDRLGNLDAATAAGTYTGSTAPGAIAASQFLNGLGINIAPNTLANSRTFQAASNQLILDFMSANGGARGFTQEESRILYDAFPRIVDSPEARKQIIDLLRQRAKEDIESYNSSFNSFQKAFPNVRTAYQPIGSETEEERYQRYLRSRSEKPQ